MARAILALSLALCASQVWAKDPLDALLAACTAAQGSASDRIGQISTAGWIGVPDAPDTRAALALFAALRFPAMLEETRAADVEMLKRKMDTALQIVPPPGVAPDVSDLREWPPVADTPLLLLSHPEVAGIVQLFFKSGSKNPDVGALDCQVSLFAPWDKDRMGRLRTDVGTLEFAETRPTGDGTPATTIIAKRKADGTAASLMLQIVEIHPTAALDETAAAAGITTPLAAGVAAIVGPIDRN